MKKLIKGIEVETRALQAIVDRFTRHAIEREEDLEDDMSIKEPNRGDETQREREEV